MVVYNQFNKTISKLLIKFKHDFAIYQNLWIWNSFHLVLKLRQKTAIYYTISMLLTNTWTYI